MALDFPSNPTNGQIYGSYYYDGASASWRSSPLTNGPAYISDTVPSAAPNGGMWYNSADGTLFIKYSNTWVEARSNTKIIPGSIVQTVQGVLADPVVFATSSSWTAIGLSASITPKFINSKILISIHIGVGGNGGTSYDAAFGLFRDSTQIALPNGYGNKAPSIMPFTQRSDSLYEMSTVSNSYMDSPGTVSAITYSIKAYATNTNTHYINRTGSDADNGGDNRMISTITLMEVAQ